MRAFVFLLILANLLFLSWTQGYFGSSSNPDAYRVQQQLLTDQVNIVSRDEPPADGAKTDKVDKSEKPDKAAEKKAGDVCMQLNELPVVDVDAFESRLAEKLPAFKSVRTTTPGSASYWVYIPPLATRQDVDNKLAELKKLHITEFFVVQESGPNNRAISLGLFSTADAANAYLETLRGKNVRSAKVAERVNKPALATLEVRGPEAQADQLRQLATDALPTIKPSACKALPLASQ